MPVWSATIPTRTTHGSSGVHIFIVNADRYENAVGHALARAELPNSRRHRRDADLDTQAVSVSIPPTWGV